MSDDNVIPLDRRRLTYTPIHYDTACMAMAHALVMRNTSKCVGDTLMSTIVIDGLLVTPVFGHDGTPLGLFEEWLNSDPFGPLPEGIPDLDPEVDDEGSALTAWLLRR